MTGSLGCRSLQKIYIPILLCLIQLSLCYGAAPQCCPQDGRWDDETRRCSDGSRIRLNCSRGYFEMIPNHEPGSNFHIIEKNGRSYAYIAYSPLIPPNEYCQALRKKDLESNVLICFETETTFTKFKNKFFPFLSILSSFFFALTLIVYLVLPELRDIQDKAIMSTSAAFAVAYFTLGFLQLQTRRLEESFCMALGSLLYYSYMSAFFWLNIISFNVWRSTWFRSYKIPSDILYILFCIYGWLCPVLLLAFTVSVPHINGFPLNEGISYSSCWFKGYWEFLLLFYMPITCLLIMNILFFILTCWKLWFKYNSIGGNRLKMFRFRCLLNLKLVLIMGIPWIFEVVSFVLKDTIHNDVWSITDFLNIMQGVITFFMLVVTRKKVLKHLAAKEFGPFSFPKAWTAFVDEEMGEPISPEELELSQSS